MFYDYMICEWALPYTFFEYYFYRRARVFYKQGIPPESDRADPELVPQ